MLAAAVEYLRALEAGGVALDAARGMIYFRLAADADQLLTIAKLRALRKLWARIEEACGLAPAPALVAAETAWRMMARRDPYVNMLRSTIAVVAAGLGGADAITRAAVHLGARPARPLRASDCAQHPAGADRGIEPRQGGRSRRRLGRRRGVDRSSFAARPGRCSRTSSGPAAPGPRSSKA